MTDAGPWRAISMGWQHSCGIKVDGTAWCWGQDTRGQLGEGSGTAQQDDPVPVTGGAIWSAVAAGSFHSCGIKTDGTAWCWGRGDQGQIGNGSTNDRQNPVQVSGGDTWTAIAAGGGHSCGIKTDGTAWCWGQNSPVAPSTSGGQLGDGTQTDRAAPVQVSGGGTWSAISASRDQTCGIKTDGTAWCWGEGDSGQLGDGSGVSSLVPVQVADAGPWSAIATSAVAPCGIKTDGSAWCWGLGTFGSLGDGNATSSTTPVQVAGGGSWTALEGGFQHTCGLKTDGMAWCWGSNFQGQGGSGSGAIEQHVPVQVAGVGSWGPFCTAPARPEGSLVYNAAFAVMQYCDGTNWWAIGPLTDPCEDSPDPGDRCVDGTIYAGLSPDGNVKMFTTPADAGQFTWNNGTTNWIDTAMANNSFTTGEANTALLVGLSDAASSYAAAVYCDGLSAHGQSDWYLPAKDELNVLYMNKTAIGGFNTSGSFPAGSYWSSSEEDSFTALPQSFSDGDQDDSNKNLGLSVRCVRR